MAVVNDAELIELYNANRRELFPALRRQGALAPLVVLLAVIPPLIAMVNDRIDSADARWGLESLELVSALGNGTAAADDESSRWLAARQQPLAAVLTGLVLKIPGLSPHIALAIVPFVCTIAVVLSWHSLCRELAGPRFAFWSTALLACHGPFLVHVQSSVPALLVLLLVLGALWGFVSHLRDAEGMVSGRLLFGGISLGLCLLASGLAAMVVIAIAMLLATAMRFDAGKPGNSGNGDTRTHLRGRWTAMRSAFVLAITAFAVGGWWVMMTAAEQGSEFWVSWLHFDRLSVSSGVESARGGGVTSAEAALFRLLDLLGLLFVPSLFGMWCLGRALWLRQDQPRRISLQFLASWLICSLVIWIAWLQGRAGMADVPDLLVILPLIASAALAIEQIALRRYRLVVAVWLVCLAFIVPLWRLAVREVPAGGLLQGGWASALSITSYLAAFSILTAWLLLNARRHDDRQRYCLVGLLVLLAASNAVQGLRSVRSSVEDRRLRLVLTEFHKSLMQPGRVEAQILITDASAPPDVEFIVRLARPDLQLETMQDWNDGIARAAELLSETKRTVLIVDWHSINDGATKPLEHKLDIDWRFDPTMIHSRRLSAFLLTRRIQPL